MAEAGRGTDARAYPSSAFVCFLENHDQVANTGRGQRLHHIAMPARWRAMVALQLLGPAVPLLFQGQECATTSPFTYFADHEGDLAEAVRTGRLEFLSQFPTLSDPELRERMPDPADEAAFRACKILALGSAIGGSQASLHGSAGAATNRHRAVEAGHRRHARLPRRRRRHRSCCCDIRRVTTNA